MPTSEPCLTIVREKVKPERDTNTFSKNAREKWWQYERRRPELYSAIANIKQMLVIPRYTKYMVCVWKPTNIICSENTCVIASDSDAVYAILHSTFHEEWARKESSSLGETLRYTPTKCFETFPFPNDEKELYTIAKHYDKLRRSIAITFQEGLTNIYNRFHDSEETAEDIMQLRALHKEMDEAVSRAYGWNDLELAHGFHETKQGVRYTISEPARREVLGRLLKLNHERYAEEEAMGLHEKGKGKGKKSDGKRKGNGGNSNRVGGVQGELVFE